MISSNLNTPQSTSPFARLKALSRARQTQERCELCGSNIASQHPHLLDLKNRQLICTCDACAILLSGETHVRYRRVPPRVELLSNLQITDEIWDDLHIPIDLAFIYQSSQANSTVAMYPGPAGVIESLPPAEAWPFLVEMAPPLKTMRSDVEALLVNRLRPRNDAFLVSIDECYKLVGLIRSKWHGLSGGGEVWKAVSAFFDDLHRRAAGRGGHGAA
jgi:hypothetical protein